MKDKITKFLNTLWPRHGWRRTARHLGKKVVRIPHSPHTVAIGIASGVFVSFTPFLGLHFFLAALVAFLLGGSLIASAIGTAIGNPLTFPFIFATNYAFGKFVLGIQGEVQHKIFHSFFHHIAEGNFSEGWEIIYPALKVLLAGGIPIGISCAFVAYIITRYAVKIFQNRKKARRAFYENKKLQKQSNKASTK